jgi:hypothetical protein
LVVDARRRERDLLERQVDEAGEWQRPTTRANGVPSQTTRGTIVIGFV